MTRQVESIDVARREALAALEDLERFARSQRAQAEARGWRTPPHDREPYFLALARRALENPSISVVNELREEFRGTGHYFAGYAPDQQGVSDRLDRLSLAVDSLRQHLQAAV